MAQPQTRATALIDCIRCSGTTKASKRCLRTIRLPSAITHPSQDTPPWFCHSHVTQASRWIASNTGGGGRQCSGVCNGARCVQIVSVPHDLDAEVPVYCVLHPTEIRLRKDPRTSVKDDVWLPLHVQGQARESLKKAMRATVTSSDGPGYLYGLEYPDRQDPKLVHIRICRTSDRSTIPKRMRECRKNCKIPVVVRGPWPALNGGKDEPAAYSHLLKRLVTIELKELNQKESNPGKCCKGCGKVHIDTFTFRNSTGAIEEISKKRVAPVVKRWAKLIEILK